jgi:hypothetical protein
MIIEEIAREIYDTLFQPPLEEPLRSIDIPLAGRGYSSESVKMVFDLVNTINGISSESLASIPDDKDGSATLKYLREVRKVAERIGSLKPSSLGLHPFVYFYGANGRFSSTAFLATAAFVKELERRNAFAKFTTIRSQFEEFLIEHKDFINQVQHDVRFGEPRLQAALLMYRMLFDRLVGGKSSETIIKEMQSHSELKFLKVSVEQPNNYGKDFSKETRNAAYIRAALEKSLLCVICKARLHTSISFDHKERKQDGGRGSPDNAQLTHFYCNTGYKESLHASQVSGS